MRQNVELYLGGQQVEFSYPVDLLYNYTLTEIQNPTVVKNSYSKTINVEGTPNNNNLFGQYWNIERQTVSTSNDTGVFFNASKKVDFYLYVNGELYETGYAKLDKINTKGSELSYDITLYGGLGSFFFLLSTNENGDKLSLADLKYTDEGRNRMWTIGNSDEGVITINPDKQNEMDLTVTKEMLYEAWVNCGPWASDTYLWHYINFVPAYNGYPDNNFSPDRVLLNMNGSKLKTEVNGYKTKSGYALGTLNNEVTEHEVRDYRSYLQRPAIRVKEIIAAIKRFAEAAGWSLELDPDFFQYENSYYEDAWMTLPMIQDISKDVQEEVLTGQTLYIDTLEGSPREGTTALRFMYGDFGDGAINTIKVKAKINLGVAAGASELYTSYVHFSSAGRRVKDERYSSLMCQLVAYNGDTLVGYSEVKNLTTRVHNTKKNTYFTGDNAHYDSSGKYWYGEGYTRFTQKSTNIGGTFKNTGYHVYTFTAENGDTEFEWTIDNCQSSITDLRFHFFWGANSDTVKAYTEYAGLHYKTTDYGTNWGTQHIGVSTIEPEIISHNISVRIKESGKTGAKLNKALLLSTDYSPCDWLLSYCKLFGLYFMKSATENKVSIMTRKSFYQRDIVKDLSQRIDRSKDIKMTPLTFDTKWYEFGLESDETEASENYKLKYGTQFGTQIVNTGYEFETAKKQLYNGNVFKSGIETLEKSKYFSTLSTDNGLRTYMLDGFSYELYNGSESQEIPITTRVANEYIYGINSDPELKYYDVIPRLQFHDKEGGRSDGNNVLCFFNGYRDLERGRQIPLKCWLTDDTPQMMSLNNEESCWFYTEQEYDQHGNKIAIALDQMPVFERYVTAADSGYITKNFDFGHSKELFVPYYTDKEGTTIYENFWQDYTRDMYDVDNRVLNCWVRLDERPNPEWLRCFYWFDNAIWRLNKIKDWNISSYDTTEMEFLKVMDRSDYTSETQTTAATVTIALSKYVVDASGATITATITVSDGGAWYIDDDGRLDISARSGVGDQTITIVVPANDDDSEALYRISVVADDRVTATIRQNYLGQVSFTVSPEDLIIPASGGTFICDVDWDYQGSDYLLNGADRNEGAEYLQFTADTQTMRAQNKIILRFAENNTHNVLSNYATFETVQQGAHYTIGLAQLPYEAGFAPTGQSQTYSISYVSGAKFEDLPYWVSAKDNGDNTYTLTALPNEFDTERSAEVTLTKAGQSASYIIKQSAGGGVISKKVTPERFDFPANGSTSFLSVNIPNSWRIVAHPAWITLSQTYGSSSAILSVTAAANEGENARTGSTVVLDVVTNQQYVITNAQLGQEEGRDITVSPNPIYFAADGEVKTSTITYTNRGSDFIEIENSTPWLSYSIAPWTGDSRTITITVPANQSTARRNGDLIIKSNELADFHIVCIQDGQPESDYSFELSSYALSLDGTQSGTTALTYTTNVPDESEIVIEGDTDWLDLSIADGTLTIAWTENPGATAKQATINFLLDGEVLNPQPLVVSLSGITQSLTISQSSISFDAEGGTATFTISSNTDWVIE